MLFTHLSAGGDKSKHNPAEPLPQSLRQYEVKAFLALVGVFTVFCKFEPKGFGTGPVQDLVNQWPNIRWWIHHFLYRALTRTASPLTAPITNDEVHLSRMGNDWTVFNIASTVFFIISTNATNFKAALANDGSFTLILKLWARSVQSPPTPNLQRTRRTFLLVDCLQIALME